MKKDMPLEGLRWSRDSGSALYDTPQNGRSRTGWGAAGHFQSWSFPVMVISGHFHFLMPCPLEKNQTGVSVAESLKRSSADGISSSSNHFFNLS